MTTIEFCAEMLREGDTREGLLRLLDEVGSVLSDPTISQRDKAQIICEVSQFLSEWKLAWESRKHT